MVHTTMSHPVAQAVDHFQFTAHAQQMAHSDAMDCPVEGSPLRMTNCVTDLELALWNLYPGGTF